MQRVERNPEAPTTGGIPAVAGITVTQSTVRGVAWTVIDLPKPVKGTFLTLRVKDNWGSNSYGINEIEIIGPLPAAPAGN